MGRQERLRCGPRRLAEYEHPRRRRARHQPCAAGGNVTGLSFLGPKLGGKRLERLKEAAPEATRAVFLADTPGQVAGPLGLREAAQGLGVDLRCQLVQDPAGLEATLQGLAGGPADALQMGVGALFLLHRARTIDFAARSHLPAMYPYEEYVDDGGLMFHGPNQPDLFCRAAWYVDKILRGTSPGDLPIELPTTFECIVNVKSARALGLTIPQSVLTQATELIQ